MTQHLHGQAREQLLADARSLYALQMTIQQVADQIGYSKTATRSILIAAGVQLRSKGQFQPTNHPAGDPLTITCPKCAAPAGSHCRADYGPARRTHADRRREAPSA